MLNVAGLPPFQGEKCQESVSHVRHAVSIRRWTITRSGASNAGFRGNPPRSAKNGQNSASMLSRKSFALPGFPPRRGRMAAAGVQDARPSYALLTAPGAAAGRARRCPRTGRWWSVPTGSPRRSTGRFSPLRTAGASSAAAGRSRSALPWTTTTRPARCAACCARTAPADAITRFWATSGTWQWPGASWSTWSLPRRAGR